MVEITRIDLADFGGPPNLFRHPACLNGLLCAFVCLVSMMASPKNQPVSGGYANRHRVRNVEVVLNFAFDEATPRRGLNNWRQLTLL